MAAKKTTNKARTTPKTKAPVPPKTGRAGSKTSFILSQPSDLGAKGVVAAGAAAGLDFTDKFVWSVRSAAKTKAPNGAASTTTLPFAAPPKKGPGRPKKNADVTGTLSASGSLESQFARLAVDIGIARAESILRRVRDQLDRMTF